jgi:hypothetical protein
MYGNELLGTINFLEYSATREYSKKFMVPKSSLPCSQNPSTGLYPDPEKSIPHQPPFYPLSLILM